MREYRARNRDKHQARQRAWRLSIRGTAIHLRNQALQRARDRGLEFDLSRDLIEQKLLKGVCEVTGIKFIRKHGRKINPLTPSLDRVNYRRGYTDDNVRVVIFAFNAARGHWGDRMTLRVAKAIVENLKEKGNGDE